MSRGAVAVPVSAAEAQAAREIVMRGTGLSHPTQSPSQRRIFRRYPDYGGSKVLDHQLRFLFR
jgi:hypothetical protein